MPKSYSQDKFIFIGGPCVIENELSTLKIAERLSKIFSSYKEVEFIFKASFDKANRTSLKSFRGPGLKKGLEILKKVKGKFGLKLLSDLHCSTQIEEAEEVLDVIQIPAFLCRQTDLIVAIARTQKIVNIKKGQFLAPWDVKYIIEKIEAQNNRKIFLTERGTSFGYNNLVVDFRSFKIMADFGYPVIFDVSHSVQIPSGRGSSSGGDRSFILPLARAGVAFGVDGLFCEVHPHPSKALSDGPNSLPLKRVKELIEECLSIRRAFKKLKTFH